MLILALHNPIVEDRLLIIARWRAKQIGSTYFQVNHSTGDQPPYDSLYHALLTKDQGKDGEDLPTAQT